MDIHLRWKPVGGFIVVDLENRMIHEGQTVDETSDPIFLPSFEGKKDILFKAQCPSLIERIVTFVIVRDTFLSQMFVFLGAIFFSNDLNPIVPILLPTLSVKSEKVLQGIQLGHLQIPVELLQGLMDPGTHKGFNPLRLDFNLVYIGEPVLMRAGFISGKLRMGIGRHLSPLLCLILVFLQIIVCLFCPVRG